MGAATVVVGRFRIRERRRQGLRWWIGRVTYNARESAAKFIDGLPCNVIGHKWVEDQLRRAATGDRKRMVILCSRCFLRNLT